MIKHTPGPWRISNESRTIIQQDMSFIGSDHGVLIGSASGHPDSGFFPPDCEAIANARLMAAAPEMLDALNRIANLDYVEVGKAASAILKAAEIAREAAAKATGESA